MRGARVHEGCLYLYAKPDAQLSAWVEATLGKVAQLPVWSISKATCPVDSRKT